jgi:uncharacterized Ntn-hydrolase superfamily protein
MTFSLAARCATTGMFGVAIASSSPAVAARCAHVRAGVGAVATQNVTDPRLGPRALDLLAAGRTAADVVAVIAATAPHAAYRQLLVVDAAGRAAIHSGARVLGAWGEQTGPDVAAGGNLLAAPGIPRILADTFGAAAGSLPDRLLAAMRAGLAAGGEAGPIHSAGLLVAHRESWPWADLRCDWTEGDPIEEVARAWRVYGPQADAYVARALDPSGAPSFGVPGDE